MKKHSTKLICLLLAVVMAVLSLPFGAIAEGKAEVKVIAIDGITPPFGGEYGREYYMTDIRIDYKKTLPGVRFSPGVANYHWLDSNGNVMTDAKKFESGKTYKMTMAFSVSDEDSYVFTNDTVLKIAYVTGGSSKLELVENRGNRIMFIVHYTCGLRPGAGATEDDPIECYSFGDLKSALEDSGAVYVRLHAVEYKDDYDNFSSGDLNAITVAGKKVLELVGKSEFQNSKPTSTQSFIIVPSLADLTITGYGGITYHAADHDDEALICNRGKLTVDENVTLSAYCRSYRNKNDACVILQRNVSTSELTVNGGYFHTVNAADTTNPHAAVQIEGGKATINAGTFLCNENDVMKRDSDRYGLYVSGSADAVIYGGEFHGIFMPLNKNFIASGSYINHEGVIIKTANSLIVAGGVTVIARYIDSLALHVSSPRPGNNPSDTVYCSHPGVIIRDIKWLEDDTGKAVSRADQFVAGKSYAVQIVIIAKQGYVLKTYKNNNKYTEYKLNNAAVVSFDPIANYAEEYAVNIFYNCMICPYEVDEVSFEIAPPVPGKRPSFTAKTGSECYTLGSDGVDWFDVTADEFMQYSDTFVEGHKYQVQLWTSAADLYSYPVDASGSPAVRAKVNGLEAKALVAYEQDPEKMIEVIMDFGECKPAVITYMRADNAVPAVDGYPRGTVDVDDYTYTAELYGVLKNGKTMPMDEPFAYGNTYKVQVAFTPAEGFTLASNVEVSITGLPADYVRRDGKAYVYSVTYVFPDRDGEVRFDESSTISEVTAYIPAPNTTQYAIFDVMTGTDEYSAYLLSYKVNGNEVAESHELKTGDTVEITISFSPKGGNRFADNLKCFINYEQANLVARDDKAASFSLTYRLLDPSAGKIGDVNGNGAIDAADYAMAKRAFLGTFKLTSEQIIRADVNGSGGVDPVDYAMIKRHFLGSYHIQGW